MIDEVPPGALRTASAASATVSKVSNRAWMQALLYVAATAMLLRFYDLPLKPLHHDEGVNAFFLAKLVQPPHVYRVRSGELSRPDTLLFRLVERARARPVHRVHAGGDCGDRDAGGFRVPGAEAQHRQRRCHRGGPALRRLARSGVFLAYCIHEMLLICFTLWAVVLAAASSPRTGLRYLCGAAAAAGLAFATKETADHHGRS